VVRRRSDKSGSSPPVQRLDPRIGLSLKWLAEGRVTRSSDLEKLFAVLHLSASRWRHLFRQSTGVSPARWYKQVRMEKARHLMAHSFFSVKEVAGMTGFNDVSHFVRDFQTAYGETPRRFRLRHAATAVLEDDPLRLKPDLRSPAINPAPSGNDLARDAPNRRPR
jgi:transcriptional regulator GlxA family with amidase domain